MTSRNLNEYLSSHLSRKADESEGGPVDKRRKVTRGVNMVREVRTRAMNNVVQDVVQKSAAAPPISNEDTECGVTEFTKEDVEALLNERFKPKKKFDQKEKSDYLAERVKKLKLCIKCFQELERNYLVEQENLRNMIELAEKKYNELEVLKQNKEEELNSIIMELRKKYSSLQESFTKEERDKLAAMDPLIMEQEARRVAERLKASLSDDLGKSEQELASANKKVSSINDMYKRLQEYNTSLQEYNSKLQKDLATANETLNQVEREKASLMQNLSTLRGHYTSLQDQLASFRTSQEDAIRQRETLATDVTCLRGELQQVRDDRDRQLSCVQSLTAEVSKYQDFFGKSSAQLDDLTAKTNLMETRCSSQSDQIRTLQDQLAAANRKLQVSDMCALETRTDYEEQKKLTFELQSRLAEAEHKILEGEVLRKRLHNTILELKGNIRVFCRVRPLLPDDGTGTEAKAILLLGSETSQEDCFVEISQLIQSALDGYKVCIFAYGQTGSGKTYTMMGKPGNHDQKGLVPRSLEQIFQTRQSLQNQGWKYEMQMSMLEIYNETIRDLLSSNRSSSDASSANAPAKQYAIKHDASGNTHVSDLIIIDVRSSKEVSFLLDQAAQSRSVGETQMNEQSSQSHFVFTLRISGTNETRCSSQSDQIRTLQDQLAAANRKLQVSDMCASETRIDYEEQKKLTFELQSRLAEAEHKILEGEVLRKRLHNTILELKGNIRVFCRVRPLLPDDGAGTVAKAILYPTSTETTGRAIDLMKNGKKHSFTFDKVLGSETSQEDCFVEISQLIQSALDGYKVCIFAYGQTGSGKTYTMMGKPGNHDQKGLVPRSLEQIFQTRQSLQNQGWKYEMQMSMLEIYNETIRDLLSSNRSSSDASSANAPAKQYAIKHDASGNTHVSDLIIIDVRSSKEVSFLLDQAAQSRENSDERTVITKSFCLHIADIWYQRGNTHMNFTHATTNFCRPATPPLGLSSNVKDDLTAKTNLMETRCSSQSDQIRTLQDQLAAANRKLQVSDMCASETRIDYEEQKKLTFELQSRLAEAEHKILEGEVLRKRLHNTILELKGNIRVFCRVRPLLPDDGAGTVAKAILYPTSTETTGRGIDLMKNGKKHSFTFDKVLGSETSQEDCFVEISQLIQSALDGYKVCIFAYGQTGSGKTYTMMGKPGNHDQKGLVPRSLEEIFQTRQSLQNQGWKYEMQMSMLEIYNETIRDLLSSNRSSSDASSANAPAKQYAIKHDASGNTHVSDLIIIDVRSSKEVLFLLDQAAQSRSVGKTQMNEQSSQSHFVFTLRISGTNESTEQQVQGVLNLIDLAGSERLSKSGATGDRLKETQAINKSLSSLRDVIFALGKKEDHVPFRNSKLTYLLQPCLGGDSKTLMFVNISPDPASIGESLCSLRLAARVNACEIGVPRRQTNVKAADSRLSYG